MLLTREFRINQQTTSYLYSRWHVYMYVAMVQSVQSALTVPTSCMSVRMHAVLVRLLLAHRALSTYIYIYLYIHTHTYIYIHKKIDR